MSQDLSIIESGVSELSLIESQVDKLRTECDGLTIKGVDDRTGFKAVREARITVKNLRCDVERRRKQLKAEPLRLCRVIDDTAKKITEMISPIECRLALEETRIVEEKARIKAEKEAAAAREAEARLKVRISALLETGEAFDTDRVASLTDLEFDSLLADMKVAAEDRKAREAAERERAEKERIAREEDERRRLERERLIRENQAAEIAALKAEKERLEKAEAARIAAEHAERERVRIEKEREEEEKWKAAVRPDADKLEAFLGRFTSEINSLGIADDELRAHVTAVAAAFKTDIGIIINRIKH